MMRLIMAIFVFIAVFAVYFFIPKYELYVCSSGGLGIYRFNKITGKLDWLRPNGDWTVAMYGPEEGLCKQGLLQKS